MAYSYEKKPLTIERESFAHIRAVTNLQGLDNDQQQVVMRIVHSLGLPVVAEKVRFSANACQQGRKALAAGQPILCDVEMVRHGLTKRLLPSDPLCFLNDPRVSEKASRAGETRTMAAMEFWLPYLENSIVAIGNAPTALFRLLEMLQEGASRPSVIIAAPVGFIGAAESKQALWEAHKELGVECITLLGTMGGSSVVASAINALLRCNQGERY